jgi:sulfur-oxidizing protein SoxX
MWARASAGLLASAVMLAAAAAQQVTPDAIPTPLTGTPGDAARGRAIVADRTRGLCLLCQLRLRVADAHRLNPDTIMPSYLRREGFNRVAPGWRGRSVLEPQEIEDVVAYLATLREQP